MGAAFVIYLKRALLNVALHSYIQSYSVLTQTSCKWMSWVMWF